MEIWHGAKAYFPFRLSQLESALNAALPQSDPLRLQADFVYLLDLARPLDDVTRERAAALLGARAAPPPDGGFVVTPRKGTISPWSSKATGIFANCGLGAIRRIERGVRYMASDAAGRSLSPRELGPGLERLHDRMVEGIYEDVSDFFDSTPPAPGRVFDVLKRGRKAIDEANTSMGLALSDDEVEYLAAAYRREGRNPTDTELVMFGQVNSEHCRHKIFNAHWIIDGQAREMSLFDMIRNTHACSPDGTLSAYRDNAAVLEGHRFEVFEMAPENQTYRFREEQSDLVIKVETHNHPTAIAPFPGAATGVGGEIRDESATGRGGRSKAGLNGLILSNLHIPNFIMPWEQTDRSFPAHLASPLEILIEAPIGGAAFGNEFGRPQICGFLRTYEERVSDVARGYHKPIMLAGGMGAIHRDFVQKQEVTPGALIVQIGGPAMRIGLGGGAASSMATGSNDENLDFDSVQRGNAEMQRRAQQVIDFCVALGQDNPILAIHDIGAGGLSNACPELVEQHGATFQLRAVHNEELSMNPMEIWCCEAQERYVLAIRPEHRERFAAICARERCPVAFIGVTRDDRRLVLEDAHFDDRPIDMDIGVLLGKPPRMTRDVTHLEAPPRELDLEGISPADALERILRLPSVASKNFLIAIADRSVTGLVHRDQMVGPYQLPLADCGVTVSGYRATSGEAMAMGERTPLAVIDAPSSGRMAVGEALTNLAGNAIGPIGQVKLSANWMCACGEIGEDAKLYDTVQAVGMELCPQLGLSIPVGKDSLSMRTLWQDDRQREHRQLAPLSLVVSAFAPVTDVRLTLTPDLKPGASQLLLIDLGHGRNRLGGGALAQVYNQTGTVAPDLDDPRRMRSFFAAMQELVSERLLLAYHDRSDGGAAVTLAEMAFGGHRGLDADLPGDPDNPLPSLFNEELGAVLQVANTRIDRVREVLARHGLGEIAHVLGRTRDDLEINLKVGGTICVSAEVTALRSIWSELSYQMQSLRDNPDCARQEFERASQDIAPGMRFNLTFDPETRAPSIAVKQPPRIAIVREQGVNGHVEMAAALTLAGCESVDLHMTDLQEGRISLSDFAGLVACGGFSYGDVLGAGSGWARSILYSPRMAEAFATFFARPDTFALGVCNGCQMLSQLQEIIPGAEHWPRFERNRSEQFEARFVTVEVLPSPSILMKDMIGSRLPVVISHGEGYAAFESTAQREALQQANLATLRYVDGTGSATEAYPLNPNGSPGGLTGLTTTDGRVTIMMPHPERGFRSVQLSYRPRDLFTGEAGPWMRMFRNARDFAAANARR